MLCDVQMWWSLQRKKSEYVVMCDPALFEDVLSDENLYGDPITPNMCRPNSAASAMCHSSVRCARPAAAPSLSGAPTAIAPVVTRCDRAACWSASSVAMALM